MDSDKTAIITVGTSVGVMERRVNDSGTLRLKIAQGWVSEKTGAGALCFELVSETASMDAPAAQTSEAPTASGPPTAFRCVKKSQIRTGFEMDSDKAGILEVGKEITAITTQTNDKGVLRVQFEGGWVSEHAGNGAVCLQATAWGEAAPAPEAEAEAAAAAAEDTEAAQEDEAAAAAAEEQAAVEAAAAAAAAEKEQAAADEAAAAEEAAAAVAAEKEQTAAEEAAAAAAKEKEAAEEAAPAEQVVADTPVPAASCAYKSAKCVKKSQARTGFDMSSDKASIIAVGTVIDVIETKVNDAGTLRIRFSGGWVSEHAGNGATCFELVRNDLGAPPAGKAPEPGAAHDPAPEPEPEPPLVVTVKEEDITPGEYKCLHAAVIREGSGMDTAKAGTLEAGERIDVLETQTLETGLVRCRFTDGWISAQLRGKVYTSRCSLCT